MASSLDVTPAEVPDVLVDHSSHAFWNAETADHMSTRHSAEASIQMYCFDDNMTLYKNTSHDHCTEVEPRIRNERVTNSVSANKEDYNTVMGTMRL